MSRWEPMLEQMLATRYGALKAYAVVLCGSPAEADDLVQDAILSTFGAMQRFDNIGLAEGYVRRAIASRFIDSRRRPHRRTRPIDDTADTTADAAAGPDVVVEHAADVARALRSLPPRERACVVLRFLDHLSTRETAQTLHISEGAVKRYLADGLAHLAPLLGVPDDADSHEWIRTEVSS